MTSNIAARVEDDIALRRGLGYHSVGPQRYLRDFAGYLDQHVYHGPIPVDGERGLGSDHSGSAIKVTRGSCRCPIVR